MRKTEIRHFNFSTSKSLPLQHFCMIVDRYLSVVKNLFNLNTVDFTVDKDERYYGRYAQFSIFIKLCLKAERVIKEG